MVLEFQPVQRRLNKVANSALIVTLFLRLCAQLLFHKADPHYRVKDRNGFKRRAVGRKDLQ